MSSHRSGRRPGGRRAGLGGFLGIGEEQVGVPLDRFALVHEGNALVLSMTRQDLENAPEVRYESGQTMPEDMQVARLVDSGEQAQTEQQAGTGRQEQAGQQGQMEIAATETGADAERETGAWTAGEITALRGKVLMVSISEEKLRQTPSFSPASPRSERDGATRPGPRTRPSSRRVTSGMRLAQTLLLRANFGKEGVPQKVITQISQESLAEMIGTTRSRVSFFMNRFRKLGFIESNGGITVYSSLLNAVLHDQPHIVRDQLGVGDD